MNLAFTSPDLSSFPVWEIPEEWLSISDHGLILIERDKIDIQRQPKTYAAMSEWSIKNMLGDDKLSPTAKTKYKKSIYN